MGEETTVSSRVYTAEASESRRKSEEEIGVEDPDQQEGMRRIVANLVPNQDKEAEE